MTFLLIPIDDSSKNDDNSALGIICFILMLIAAAIAYWTLPYIWDFIKWLYSKQTFMASTTVCVKILHIYVALLLPLFVFLLLQDMILSGILVVMCGSWPIIKFIYSMMVDKFAFNVILAVILSIFIALGIMCFLTIIRDIIQAAGEFIIRHTLGLLPGADSKWIMFLWGLLIFFIIPAGLSFLAIFTKF